MELIVGDAVINNPFRFNIGTVTLKFPELTSTEGADKSASYKQKPNMYITKPEIKVIFLRIYVCTFIYMPMLVSDRDSSIILSLPKHWQRIITSKSV